MMIKKHAKGPFFLFFFFGEVVIFIKSQIVDHHVYGFLMIVERILQKYNEKNTSDKSE